MIDRSFLSWPFFEERHRSLAAQIEDWCKATIHDSEASDPDYACRALVQELGRAGFLKLCVGDGLNRVRERAEAEPGCTQLRERNSNFRVWRKPFDPLHD